MKIYLIIMLLFFMAPNSFGQNLSAKPRVLKLLSNQDNYTIERLRKNKKGEILRLEQVTLEQRGDTLIRITETYKRNKFWKIFTSRDIIHAEKDVIKEPEDYYIIKEIDERIQELNLNGRVIYNYLYGSNILESTLLSYYYYPNGALKLVVELKEDRVWNVIAYKNIDGSEHDYGNYKNGSGTIIWLDDDGNSCPDWSLLK